MNVQVITLSPPKAFSTLTVRPAVDPMREEQKQAMVR